MKNPEIKIGSRKIGLNHPPLIIVELGINHNGNFKLAKQLIKSAKNSGAEIIKHQTHLPFYEMSEEAKKIVPVHTKENIYRIIEKCALKTQDEKKLKKFVESKNMEYLSTPFSREAADFLNSINVKVWDWIRDTKQKNYGTIKHVENLILILKILIIFMK